MDDFLTEKSGVYNKLNWERFKESWKNEKNDLPTSPHPSGM